MNCTVCKSCSGCKHCAKEGGICGFSYTPPKKEPKVMDNLDTLVNDTTKVKKRK